MKINNFHLTYCSNIHPGESWSQVFANLQEYIPTLQTRLTIGEPFGIGLRLADIASRELLEGNNLAKFKKWLKKHNLYVFTLNGFPYGGFHNQVVKDQVYAPDWSKTERLDYTLRLIQILAKLLPDGIEGSISTLPLSYKPWFQDNQLDRTSTIVNATLNLARAVVEMARIRTETGKMIHLDLEPEPDGMIENAAEVVDYFQTYLLPISGAYLRKYLRISQKSAETILLDHVQICYDTCHFAVEYENPISVLRQFEKAGIKIGKIQISAALQVNLPKDIQQRYLVQDKLQNFAESTYLHQVIAREGQETFHHYSDLETALPSFVNSTADEWRIHFHVPIFIRDYELLQSTQDDIIRVLELLKIHNFCSHLEIETYTWEVLPSAMKLDIIASIQREYEWVLKQVLESDSLSFVEFIDTEDADYKLLQSEIMF
jgi:sugar phosphate isomerase/epimerase